MPFFLLTMILLLSQHVLSMNYSLKQIEQYENKGIEEILRGHPELLSKIQQKTAPKSPRKTTNNPIPPLKDSTDKINNK